MLLPLSLGCLHLQLFSFFADAAWRNENKKSKSGAEKARIKKRKALETDAAKCAKICSFFNKTSSQSETTNDDDETGKDKMLNKMQLYLHYWIN